jgi:hypothetical protein
VEGPDERDDGGEETMQMTDLTMQEVKEIVPQKGSPGRLGSEARSGSQVLEYLGIRSTSS